MTFDRNKNTTKFNAVCYGYKKKTCNSKRYFVAETEVENFVLSELRELFKNRINKNELAESAKGCKINVELEGLNKQEKTYSKALDNIQLAIRSLYKDKLKGIVTERDFVDLSEDFIKEREALEIKLEDLKQREAQLLKYQDDSKEILKAIDDFIENEVLSKTTLHKLINRIEVFKDRSIKLYANFSCE